MKNQFFQSPEKSQSNIIYRKLGLQQESQILIEDLIQQQRFYSFKGKKFSELPEDQQIICAIFILYFQDKLKELQKVNLSLLVDKIFILKKKCEAVQLTFRIIRDLKKQQKLQIPNFEQIHNLIGYFGIIFTIFKKIKHKFDQIFDNENFKKIWVILVLLSKKQDIRKNISFQELLDLMSALLLFQILQNSTEEQFIYRRKQLAEYSYELNDQEFQQYKAKIKNLVPDFNGPFFDCQEYIQQFYQIKEKYDVNYLMFLEEQSTEENKKNVILTPIVRNSRCTANINKDKKDNIFKTNPLQDISLETNFNDIQIMINSRQQRLLSPTLKKQFEESDRTLDLPKMFQWYKTTIKNIELTKITIQKKIYLITVQCSDILNDPKIRENYSKILNIAQNFQSTKINILKLFFALMQQFLKYELQRNEKKQIYEVFKESEFMLSLFCLSLSIDSLITKNNKQRIQEYISLCQISFFSFWKILSLLAKNLATSLPVIIRSRIVELEHFILLKLIWQTDKNSKNEADIILKQVGYQHKIAIKNLLNILIERIYLISQKIKLKPLLIQKVWEFVTYLLKQHITNNNIRLENIHLDQIVILTINHIRIINSIYGGLGQILKIYNENCLFPIVNLSKEALVQYYKYDFQNLLNYSTHIQFKVKKQKLKDENPNSTPIGNQIKKIPQQVKQSSVFDSFELQLNKKQQSDAENCSIFTRKDSIQMIKKRSRFSFQHNIDNNDPSLNQNIQINNDLICFNKLGDSVIDKQETQTANITMTTPLFTEYNFSPEIKKSGQRTPTF